jgi:DNA (cytosine-5)-methyltransferase 1
MEDTVAGTLRAEGENRPSRPSHIVGLVSPVDAAPRSTFWNGADVAETLTCTSNDQRMPDKNKMRMVVQPVAFDTTQGTSPNNRSNPRSGDPCHPLAAGAHPPVIAFTGDGVVADPIGANEAKTYTNEGSRNFCLHNCVGEPRAVGVDSYNLCETGDVQQTLKSPQGGVTESMGAVLQSVAQSDVAGPLDAHYYKGSGSRQGGEREYVAQAISFAAPAIGTFSETEVAGVASVMPLKKVHGSSSEGAGRNSVHGELGDPMFTLDAGSRHGVAHKMAYVQSASMAVRRLTVVECERLQGFPDDYTRIPWKRKSAEECPDGGRYKALGNSMAVNCMRWIGRRIELVEAS